MVPELPEVETIVRGLRPLLEGRVLGGATVRWPRMVGAPSPEAFVLEIAGRRVESVGRRGKYVVIALDRGCLLIHLKMSGRLSVTPAGEPLDAYTHVVVALDDGNQLRFRDVRKFGRVYLVDDAEAVTGNLGPEPLSEALTLERFRGLLARRRGWLKPLLLNQGLLAGLGNIYADEALFAARLHPLRKADSLSPAEQGRLYDAIRSVLGRAVTRRGTTLADSGYVDADGRAGAYQDQIAVYGRRGEPCVVCGGAIERLVVAGRSAHFCPRCQPVPD